jgi:excisionase family DNA binding protein
VRSSARASSSAQCERALANVGGAPVDLAGRLTLRPAEAARALGLSDRTFRAMLPTLPHFRVGTAVLIPVDGLRQWVAESTRVSQVGLGGNVPAARPRSDGEAVAAEVLERLRDI